MKAVIKLFLIISVFFSGYDILLSQDKEDVDSQVEEIIIEKKGQTTNIQKETEEETTYKQRVFLQIGAIESKTGNKFMLRKKNSRLEFFIDDKTTSVFLKEIANPQNVEIDNFLIIRGYNNKKAVIANAVYIYKNKELYDDYINRIDDEKNKKIQQIFGVVLNPQDLFDKFNESLRPILIGIDNNEKMLFFYDDTTYWVMIKKINYSDINTGDRVILYFDQRISLRIKNIPFKVVVSRIAVGY